MPDIDPRDVVVPDLHVDPEILKNVKDENQRRLLRETMQSKAWKTYELVQRISELSKENKSLKRAAADGEQAVAQLDKALARAKAAEKRASAAERQTEKERGARNVAESELQTLEDEIRQAVAAESRLERLAKARGL